MGFPEPSKQRFLMTTPRSALRQAGRFPRVGSGEHTKDPINEGIQVLAGSKWYSLASVDQSSVTLGLQPAPKFGRRHHATEKPPLLYAEAGGVHCSAARTGFDHYDGGTQAALQAIALDEMVLLWPCARGILAHKTAMGLADDVCESFVFRRIDCVQAVGEDGYRGASCRKASAVGGGIAASGQAAHYNGFSFGHRLSEALGGL